MFSSCLSSTWFQLKIQNSMTLGFHPLSITSKIPKALRWLQSHCETCGLASCRNNRRSSPLALQIWRRQLDGRVFPWWSSLTYRIHGTQKILCQRYQLHIVYTPFLHFWGSLCHYFVISVYSIITMEFEDSETLWLKSCRTFHTLVPSLLHFHWREVMQTDTYES